VLVLNGLLSFTDYLEKEKPVGTGARHR